jgi:hypothetical protein
MFVQQADLPVVGMAGARGVESQGEELREAFHGRMRVAFVVERIALALAREGAQTGGKMPVGRLPGPGRGGRIGAFGGLGRWRRWRRLGRLGRLGRISGLTRVVVAVIVRLPVVGAGVVLVFHMPRDHGTFPATGQPPISNPIHFHHMPRSNMLSQGLPRSGLVQQKTTPNPQEDSKQ